MRGKKRPSSERAKAVGIALMDGAQAASDAMGIPRTTIVQWMDLPEYAELRQKTPEAVSDMFWAAVQIGVDQVAQGLLRDEPLRDKAVALGILYDKHALMTGQVTGRIESVNLTDDLPADVKRELRARLARSTRGESELVGAEGDPVGAGEPVDS